MASLTVTLLSFRSPIRKERSTARRTTCQGFTMKCMRFLGRYVTGHLQCPAPYWTLPGEHGQALHDPWAWLGGHGPQLSHTLSRQRLAWTPVSRDSSPRSQACVDCKALFSSTPGDTEVFLEWGCCVSPLPPRPAPGEGTRSSGQVWGYFGWQRWLLPSPLWATLNPMCLAVDQQPAHQWAITHTVCMTYIPTPPYIHNNPHTILVNYLRPYQSTFRLPPPDHSHLAPLLSLHGMCGTSSKASREPCCRQLQSSSVESLTWLKLSFYSEVNLYKSHFYKSSGCRTQWDLELLAHIISQMFGRVRKKWRET